MRETGSIALPLALCACAVLALAACGKKGNPLPPLQRIPSAPLELTVSRVHDAVYVRYVVPTTNIDGASPADVARVELYAITLAGSPAALQTIEPDDLRKKATLVASERVRRPIPPPPPAPEGVPPFPAPPPAPGVDQGTAVVVREPLTPDLAVPVTLPDPVSRSDDRRDEFVPRPLVAPPPGAGLQRHYFAVAVSQRGRYGPHSAIVPAPLGPTSGPPSEPVITVEETSMTLEWSPPRDARGVQEPPDPSLLPARPLVPPPPPTTYDVYEVTGADTEDAQASLPVPLNPEPIGATAFTQHDIVLGTERCFVIRPVDILDGLHVRGPASPVACASFADTFAPSPPVDLVAVAVPGAINLIWDASTARDLAGYIVLRGVAGSGTLTPLMDAPFAALSYRDGSVQPGVRYVYAVVAVDKAGNRSTESNRVEEAAR